MGVEKPTSRSYLLKDPSDYQWQDVRDYALWSIFEYCGPFERQTVKENSVFKSFFGRYGPERSVAIIRFAFGVSNGLWYGNPIGVNKFSKGADPYFAEEILKLIGLKETNGDTKTSTTTTPSRDQDVEDGRVETALSDAGESSKHS